MIRFTEMRGAFCAALLAGSMLATPATAQSLDDAVGAALARSPAIEAARARADAGAAQVDAARAERAPQAVIEGQVGVGRLNPEGYFGLTADNVTPRQARATVELPIFTGGRVSAAVAAAQGGADAAQLNLRLTALELRVRVVAAYSDAVAGTAMIRRYEQLVTALEEMVRGANLRFQTGGATSTEVAQAQARLAEAQAGLAAARGQLAQAQAQLTTLTGGPIAVLPELPAPPALPASREEATERALQSNPALGAAQRMADVAEARRNGARAERLPSVGAYAEGSVVRDQFFPGYIANSASVGLRAQWTLFSGGRQSAHERVTDAEMRAARADAEDARLRVQEQAIGAFEDASAARAVLGAAEARARAADEALRGTRLEVQAGAQPQLAQLDAERESIEATAAMIAARGRMLVAAYRLRAIAGMD